MVLIFFIIIQFYSLKHLAAWLSVKLYTLLPRLVYLSSLYDSWRFNLTVLLNFLSRSRRHSMSSSSLFWLIDSPLVQLILLPSQWDAFISFNIPQILDSFPSPMRLILYALSYRAKLNSFNWLSLRSCFQFLVLILQTCNYPLMFKLYLSWLYSGFCLELIIGYLLLKHHFGLWCRFFMHLAFNCLRKIIDFIIHQRAVLIREVRTSFWKLFDALFSVFAAWLLSVVKHFSHLCSIAS